MPILPIENCGIGKTSEMVYLKAVKPMQFLRAKWLALTRALLLLFLLAFLGPAPVHAQVVINEVMANNATTVANRAGLFSDWIELYNAGTVDVNIGTYALSDSPVTNKYFFPANTIIHPHEHLMVWCDSTNGAGELHANFSLSASGEYVG